MGRDKALLELGGAPMLVAGAAGGPRVASVTVVGPRERYASLGLVVIPASSITRLRGDISLTTLISIALKDKSREPRQSPRPPSAPEAQPRVSHRNVEWRRIGPEAGRGSNGSHVPTVEDR